MTSSKRRILLIEGDASAVEEVRFLLESSYQIDIASDGFAALQLAKDLKPDLIITAILLPKLDGFQLCRELKSKPDTANIPILVCSSLLAESRVKQLGADAFLAKPVDGRVLRQTVAKLLRRSRR